MKEKFSHNELENFTDLVLDYIQFIYNPRKKWSPVSSNHFKQESYQKWAINESIKYVFAHPNQSPLNSLLNFVDILDNYSCIDEGFIFSSAKEAVEDMIFNCMKIEYYSKGE